MLLLSRRVGEEILFPALGVRVEVVKIHGNRVRLGVSAPPKVTVHRSELLPSREELSSTGTTRRERHTPPAPRSHLPLPTDADNGPLA